MAKGRGFSSLATEITEFSEKTQILPRHSLAPDARTGVRPWQVCALPWYRPPGQVWRRLHGVTEASNLLERGATPHTRLSSHFATLWARAQAQFFPDFHFLTFHKQKIVIRSKPRIMPNCDKLNKVSRWLQGPAPQGEIAHSISIFSLS